MAKDIQTIKSQFQIIQNETIEDANTANRVGGAGYDLAEFVGENRTGIIPWFETETQLNAAFPSPSDGQQVWLGTPYPGTVWSSSNGIWSDTEEVPNVGVVDLTQYTLNGSYTGTSKDLYNESNKYFTKYTDFPITGAYYTDNVFHNSTSWRSKKISGVSGDMFKYHVYVIGPTSGGSTPGANIITFVDSLDTIVSTIPATGNLLALATGIAVFPDGATGAYISTHNTYISSSYYETSRTLKQVDEDAGKSSIKYTDFPITGFYQTSDNTLNTSINWRNVEVEGVEGEVINYHLYSILNANIATFKDDSGNVISAVPATGNILGVRSGFVTFPSGATKCFLSTHNTGISDSYYEKTSTNNSLFTDILNSIKIISDNSYYNTYVVKAGVATNPSSFETFTEAAAVAKKGDLILIFPGTYNEYGIKLSNGVTVKGVGQVIINGYLPQDATTSQIDNTSTIDLFYNGRLENITVIAQNMRYAVHSDFSGGNTRQDIINCRFIHKGNTEAYQYRVANDSSLPTGEKASDVFRAMSAWGAGTAAGDKRFLKGCYFESNLRGFSTHNNTGFDTTYGASLTVLDGCEFISHGIDRDGSNLGFLAPVVVQNLASNSPDKVIINSNCKSNGYIGFTPALTHNVVCGLKNIKTIYNTLGGGKMMLDQLSLIDVTKYPVIPNETDNFKNLGSQTISRGKAVKKNSYGVELMTSSDDASLFFGVAMQNIEINKCGDVTTEGYLIRPYLDGLSATILADGDSISVTSTGSFEKSTTKVVCKAVDNQNILVM